MANEPELHTQELAAVFGQFSFCHRAVAKRYVFEILQTMKGNKVVEGVLEPSLGVPLSTLARCGPSVELVSAQFI